MMPTTTESLRQDLTKLKLNVMAANLDSVLEETAKRNRDAAYAFKLLLAMETEARWKTSIARRFADSKLVEQLSIDQFDWNHHHSRRDQKGVITSLLNPDFIDQRKDVIFIGNTGTGKTMLAKTIALAACNHNRKVLFTTATDIINHLATADADNSLLKKLALYQTPDLLVCDELGFLPLGQQGSHLFFQVISARHKLRSTILTTNLSFAEWGNVFDSTTVATAIADRLVHNSEVIILGGPSYRRKRK
jgi:DNA replication protein DnaC